MFYVTPFLPLKFQTSPVLGSPLYLLENLLLLQEIIFVFKNKIFYFFPRGRRMNPNVEKAIQEAMAELDRMSDK